MNHDEFRYWGHRLVDWIAEYWEQVERYPVAAQVQPGDIRRQLPDTAPVRGEPFQAVLRDVEEILLPGIMHWQSPNFYAYFPGNNSPPSVLGELLSAGLGVQGMMWATSPACTELESLVLDWLVDMLGLPSAFLSSSQGGGVIQDSASSATLCALLAARERATGGDSNREGNPGHLTAYASNQAHSSVEKGVRIAGLGSHNLRMIDVDPSFAMRPDRLRQAILDDRNRGQLPCFVCATVGTTSSTALDPVREIGEICREFGIWLHVDAAMAGTAALCPEFRYLHADLERADSYCFNPHKWMFTNFDCSCLFLADRRPLIQALSILPEYLRNEASASGAVIDYRDWQIPLGRRFRALKLWFVIRSYGIEGLQARIRLHVQLAQEFADWVRQDPRFELAAPVPLCLVCFRHRGGDAANQQLLEQLNASGRMFLSHTRLDDQLTLRMSIAQSQTQRPHVQQAWQQIQQLADRLASRTSES